MVISYCSWSVLLFYRVKKKINLGLKVDPSNAQQAGYGAGKGFVDGLFSDLLPVVNNAINGKSFGLEGILGGSSGLMNDLTSLISGFTGSGNTNTLAGMDYSSSDGMNMFA